MTAARLGVAAAMKGRSAMSSDWEQSVGSAVGSEIALAVASRRIRKIKQRLIEATVGGLAQGEELRVVTYAQYGNIPAIIWWELGVLAILVVAIFLPFTAAFQILLVVGYCCGFALWFAHVLLFLKTLGVVLTDRRLILFHQAAVTRRLRGVLLDVPRDHVSHEFRPGPLNFGVKLVLRFDDTIGHAPIKLNFSTALQLDAKAMHAALNAKERPEELRAVSMTGAIPTSMPGPSTAPQKYAGDPGAAVPQYAGDPDIATVAQQKNGLAIASLILGIIGVLTSWLIFTFPISIVGIVLAAMGLRRSQGKGLAIAGLVLSIIGVVVAVTLFILIWNGDVLG